MDGIIVIDKPRDITSFGVVSKIRRIIGEKKVGHMGTLDPMATGVLPIMLGFATKSLELISDHSKQYIAELKFGITTDTEDITGNIIKTSNKSLNEDDLKNVLIRFRGQIEQCPPMYSAIKKDGIRLYDLARKGIEIDRKKRLINIHRLDLIDFNECYRTAKLRIGCSRGTYIRTLCSDIGKALGVGATMTNLRRTLSNGFTIANSIEIDDVYKMANQGNLNDKIFPVEYVFRDLKRVDITQAQAIRFSNGGGLLISRLNIEANLKDSNICRVYFKKFIGLGRISIDNDEVKALRIFSRYEKEE